MSAVAAPVSPLVELRDIHKSFGQNHVLRGVSLGLNKGTILADDSTIAGTGCAPMDVLEVVYG